MSLTLPEPFLARTEPLLGDATAAFLQAMNDTYRGTATAAT